MSAPIDVLVVDEDSEMVGLTKTFLERNSDRIDADTETDPTAVLDRVRTENVDCVVSDLRMPEMDGIELAEQLSEHQPAVRFLLFTAARKEIDENVEDAPITDYVQKGSGTEHYERLAEKIEDAVESADED